MKNLYLLLMLACLYLPAFGQNWWDYNDDRYSNYNMYSEYEKEYPNYQVGKYRDDIRLYHISEIDELFTLKKFKSGQDSVKFKKVYEFDTAGHMIEMRLFSSKNKPGKHRTNIYNNGRIAEKSYYKANGKLDYRKTYRYDSLLNLVEYESYGKNGKKLLYKTISTYDSTKIRASYSFKKDGKTLKYRWEYEHSPNGYISSVFKYNAKGKLLHAWTPDCSIDTIKKRSHKDTSFYCSQKEYDKDSNRIYTYRQLDAKNHLVKYISIYNKKNHLIKWSVYNEKNKISNECICYPDTELIKTITYYDKKGKMSGHQEYIYDQNWKNTSWIYWDSKNKLLNKYTYSYNHYGLKTSYISQYKKNSKRKTYFLYAYFK